MPARRAFLPALLPTILHCRDLARHIREESIHPHPRSRSKVDFAPPRVRVNCCGRFPLALSLEGMRALRRFALNLLESALAKNARVTPLGSALTNQDYSLDKS
jgi:hypothetical protein